MASQTKHLVEITPEQIQEFKNLAKEQEKTFLSEDAIVDTVEHVDVSHLYQRIEVKGVSINYVKVGTGEKPVLLMCGSVGKSFTNLNFKKLVHQYHNCSQDLLLRILDPSYKSSTWTSSPLLRGIIQAWKLYMISELSLTIFN